VTRTRRVTAVTHGAVLLGGREMAF